jgi:lipoprotein-anchoring transpeptidase ErfK/SrfK
VWTAESVNAPLAAETTQGAPDLNLPADSNTTNSTDAGQTGANAQAGNRTDFILDTQPDPVPEFDIRTIPAAQATHIVQAGETLGRIAVRYSVTTADIVAANGLANPDQIFVGQALYIPAIINGQVITSISTFDAEQGPQAIPTPEITTGKFVLVDLSDSMVYAFQDGVLMYMALGSMGLPITPTVQGKFAVYHRYEAQTMSGPGYYLPNVQWVQYFYKGYALHGAYWHNNWGQPMSHGCVNMRNVDAEWFYRFGEIGMPVHVQA